MRADVYCHVCSFHLGNKFKDTFFKGLEKGCSLAALSLFIRGAVFSKQDLWKLRVSAGQRNDLSVYTPRLFQGN
jgi:hypothetical protein